MKKALICRHWFLMMAILIIGIISHSTDVLADDNGLIIQIVTNEELQTCAMAEPVTTSVIIENDQAHDLPIFKSTGSLGLPPPFSAGTNIKASGTDIKFYYYTAPCVTDWNEDGKKDLLVGEFWGYIYLFLNSGTNSSPVFTTSSKLKAGGSDIQVAYG